MSELLDKVLLLCYNTYETKDKEMKMTDISRIASQVAQKFVKSDSLRGYSCSQFGQMKAYTLDLELIAGEHGDRLEVTTWGYDYESIRIPQTWQELIRTKMYLQLIEQKNGPDKVFLRYCFHLMRAVDKKAG